MDSAQPLQAPVGQGCLLVASPALQDGNFSRSVVLVITHTDEGSFGLVLNRPLGHTLSEVLPDLPAAAAAIPVHQGGPVQTEVLQFVSRDTAAGRQVLPGISVGASLEELLSGKGGPACAVAFLGYAGWGPGQLERETVDGSWIVAPARVAHVFDIASGRLWAAVLRELGGRYAWMAFEAADPGDN